MPDTFPLQNDGHEDKVLSSQSYELKKKVPDDKLGKLAGEKKATAWERQIRPYMFQPCQLVKDRHTGVDSSNVNTVMDRDLNQFIDASLVARSGTNGQNAVDRDKADNSEQHTS